MNDEGQFPVSVSDQEITLSDAYVFRPDGEVAYLMPQEAYEGEVVVLRVSVAGSEAGRYVFPGSQHCVVLNEGY